MSKIQEKWRDSLIDVDKIPFKNISFQKIISYPPAGNDVFECIGKYKNKNINFVLKSERGKFANFSNEIKVLEKVKDSFNVPTILEHGVLDDHVYIAMTKIDGEKLSDIFKEQKDADHKKYLYLYGQALAKIHKLKLNWDIAKQRDINDFPKKERYNNLDKWEVKVIEYLEKTKPKIEMNTFIHGDFHYGNILWDKYEINGILDWEYSGLGFKEQDIAWALILRPGQQFMDKKEDRDIFLKGYLSTNKYNEEKLKWCFINGTMHFYLMNKNNKDKDYLKKLKTIINSLINV